MQKRAHAKEEASKNAYNRMAQNYDESPEGQYTKAFKELIAREAILHVNDRVLDVACGTGELLKRLNRKCPIQGTGVDISDEMIRVAKTSHPGFAFNVSSCAPLQYVDNTWDVVTVSAAFHHFPDPHLFAREAYRTLKSGGRLYAADPFYPSFLRILANTIFLPLYNAGDVKVYHPTELQRIFTTAGFTEVSTRIEGKAVLLKASKP